jgi:prophage regulatory protein
MYQSKKELDQRKKENDLIDDNLDQSFSTPYPLDDENSEKTKVLRHQMFLRRLIRIRKVVELTGLSKSYIYALSKEGLFPKSVQLVPGGSSVAWESGEIQDWIKSRIDARDGEI